MGRPVVELELSAAHARDLSAGGVFVTGCGLEMTEECDLVVRGSAGVLPLRARVVFVDPTGRGAGLELVGFGPELRQRIAELVHVPVATPPPVMARPATPTRPPPVAVARPATPTRPPPMASVRPATPTRPPASAMRRPAPPPPPVDELELAPEPIRDVSAGSQFDFAPDPALDSVQTYEIERELDLAPPPAPAVAAAFDPDATQPIGLDEMDDPDDYAGEDANAGEADDRDLGTDGPTSVDAEPLREGDDVDAGAEADDESEPGPDGQRRAPTLHERIRGLTLAQQMKIAHAGETQERVLLERLYGKTVWEALLRNPRITAPEIARIARMGALPRPLLEIIVNNAGWLQIPEIRRALLTHPRLAPDQATRILRLLPKHELKLATAQTAYPAVVREQARRMLRA